jgi:hypothetical protein
LFRGEWGDVDAYGFADVGVGVEAHAALGCEDEGDGEADQDFGAGLVGVLGAWVGGGGAVLLGDDGAHRGDDRGAVDGEVYGDFFGFGA